MNSERDDLVVVKDDTYNHRAAHWSDLHHLIHDALPSGIVRFGHEVLSFEELEGPRVRVRVSEGDGTAEEVEADSWSLPMVPCHKRERNLYQTRREGT